LHAQIRPGTESPVDEEAVRLPHLPSQYSVGSWGEGSSEGAERFARPCFPLRRRHEVSCRQLVRTVTTATVPHNSANPPSGRDHQAVPPKTHHPSNACPEDLGAHDRRWIRRGARAYAGLGGDHRRSRTVDLCGNESAWPTAGSGTAQHRGVGGFTCWALGP